VGGLAAKPTNAAFAKRVFNAVISFMPIISYTYKVRGGIQHLYAVGDRQAIVQAIRNSFVNHEMPIHREKDQTIYHYPGGWIDRTSSALSRFCSAGGSPPQSDCFSIKFSATNNPLVTTILVNLYHKTGWFRDALVQERITKFYRAFEHEFRIFEIPLIGVEHWNDFAGLNPEFRCSPVWTTATGFEERMESKRNSLK
jgi:hypothetical protein